MIDAGDGVEKCSEKQCQTQQGKPVFCVTRPDGKPQRPHTQAMLMATISTMGAELLGKCLRASIVVLRRAPTSPQ